MKTIILNCTHCNKSFPRLEKEYKRQQVKLGSLPFCSCSCTAIYKNTHTPVEKYRQLPQCKNIGKYCHNQVDEYSPFRQFMAQCRDRVNSRKLQCDLDLPYLKLLWEQQKGICPYTGLTMVLPETTAKYAKLRSLQKASLDRIDSSLGYIKGNVEFVCQIVNFAKNTHSKKDVMLFFENVKKEGQKDFNL